MRKQLETLAITVLLKITRKLAAEVKVKTTNGIDFSVCADCLRVLLDNKPKISMECSADWWHAYHCCQSANYKPENRGVAIKALKKAIKYC